MLIWLTNFMIFGLWYWEIDRGGPGRRAGGEDGPPDFLFPQMSDDAIQPAQLAAPVRRLPVRVADERDRLLPHRHDAAEPHGQDGDGAAIDHLDRDDRADHLACGEHPLAPRERGRNACSAE